MFTGLVEGRGTVSKIQAEGAAIRLTIVAPAEIVDESVPQEICRVGDSVAINGCCLTVVHVEGQEWTFQAGVETLSKTNLGRLQSGAAVNLERPLRFSDRLGGHFVQGHVDGVGEVDKIEHDGEWITMWFRVPVQLADQMVPKGSVAVDGISLTLVDVESRRFSVALIPHTLEVTTLGVCREGDVINVETDILGKYIQKLQTPQDHR
jgi:riboflavin synthase